MMLRVFKKNSGQYANKQVLTNCMKNYAETSYKQIL